MRTHEASDDGIGRRTFLAGVGATTAGTALASSAPVARASQSDPSLEEWFANADNYEGVVNKTGLDEVVVAVGSNANGGAFGYGPAAIRVDPRTTVRWEWTGEGGSHDVAAKDGSFASPLVADASATFEHTFDAEGTTIYSCTPHEIMGMKGAVVVGDASVGGAASMDEPDYGDWFVDVDNFESTVDARGTDEVTVAVGADGNGGAFAFDPPAVRVDPGTTVVWEWTGDGGGHDVVDSDGDFASDLSSTAGNTFALTFDGNGISTYSCTPHEAMGMKGAVVVGEYATAGITVGLEVLAVGGALAAAVLSPIALLALLVARGIGPDRPDPGVAYLPDSPGEPDDGRSRRTLRRLVDEELTEDANRRGGTS